MTKQEEIRKGIFDILFGTCMHITDSPDDKTNEILFYLHSQGVMIKVESNLSMYWGNYEAVEPLIEEPNGATF